MRDRLRFSPDAEGAKADAAARSRDRQVESRPPPAPEGVSHRPRPQPPSGGKSERDLRLDFFRGLALFFIFFDHIPYNFLTNFTLRSVAFFDAAEVFVFISGYAAALAYGKVLRTSGLFEASLRILHRVWQLYVAHVFIFIVLAALVSHVARAYGEVNPGDFGLQDFMDDPTAALVQVLLLQYQPRFLDILPLYIVLLATFPAILFLLARNPLLALVPSAALYLLTRLLGWEVRGYPGDHLWYFNPLAWQFIFVIGVALGYYRREFARRMPTQPWFVWTIAVLAALVAVVSASWVLNYHFSRVPAILIDVLAAYADDKTNLSPLRLGSFLILALAVAYFVRPDSRFLRTGAAGLLIMCGRNSLHVFCLGILLAAIGEFVVRLVGGTFAVQMMLDTGGCALMIGLAALLDWSKADERFS